MPKRRKALQIRRVLTVAQFATAMGLSALADCGDLADQISNAVESVSIRIN